MGRLIGKDKSYIALIGEIKSRIRQVQLKAAIQVNREMLRLYWSIGQDIMQKNAESTWGEGVINQISRDLMEEFPSMKGFSVSNLKYMRRFYLFYQSQFPIGQQAVDQLGNSLFSIPWGHHIQIMTKCKSVTQAMFYINKTIENSWSRNILLNFLSADYYEAQGKTMSNFKTTLPAAQGDLVQQIFKDPYKFDFLALTEDYREKEFENALVDNITKTLLELGNGFAYIGKQVRLLAGDDELFIDLLFYNVKIYSYVVVELKSQPFNASFIGQLGLYVSAVNHLLKTDRDNPTIGLLICKEKNQIKAQWALESSSQPIGISEYQLTNILPKEIKSSLPSIEEIESELEIFS